MIEIQLFDIEKILTLGNPKFIIEDAKIQDLNGGIKKKFTSLSKSPVTYTNIYDPTIFRWKFGDEEDPDAYTETTERVIYHTYQQPGTYLVKHQACNFCTCSDWSMCFQYISVVPPKFNWPALALGGFFGLIILRKECDEYKTKKECEEESHCQWLEREKKCVKRCEKGYKLEKERIDRIKRPSKFVCVPIKKVKEKSKAKK